MECKKTLIKLAEVDYENITTINIPESSKVIIEKFMFRDNIISGIQIKKLKASEASEHDSIMVKTLMGNLILGVYIFDNDIVLEIEKGKYNTDYFIRKSESYDYIL